MATTAAELAPTTAAAAATTAAIASQLLTPGEVARRLNVDAWQIARVCARGLFPQPPRVGRSRVFSLTDLPRLRVALALGGYLPAEAATEETAAVAGQ